MRLLDRYVLSIFLAAFVVFLLAFVFLFVVVDFSARLPRFLSLKDLAIGPFILRYYGVRLPFVLWIVLPAIALFAAMFTLVRLQKANELVPVVVSGVSLHRVSVPFVAVSALCAAAVFALDEWVLPAVTTSMSETEEALLANVRSKRVVAYDRLLNYVTAAESEQGGRVLRDAQVTRSRESGRPIFVVQAAAARWDETRRRWVFSDGSVTWYDEDGQIARIEEPGRQPRMKREAFGADGYVLESCKIAPEELQRRALFAGEFDGLRDLRRKIREYPQVAAFRAALHRKFAFPLSGVILLLLGLPFVVSAQGRSFVRGLTLCLLVCAAYYVAFFLLGNLEDRLPGGPVTATWAAPVGFGAAAALLFARMKS